MKKLIFSLALLLMSVSAALAQTWDFSEDGVSESDKANLEADAASTTPLWTVENTTSNFHIFEQRQEPAGCYFDVRIEQKVIVCFQSAQRFVVALRKTVVLAERQAAHR